MMNLSMSHPVPTFGDSLTITCYVCGMPSSKEWAQKARSRPSTPMKSYFPFLLQVTPLGGAVLREDGTTYLCAFCHASLECQWSVYESQQVVPPPNRKYNIQKFICAVCGVETYRKRIRALPFQEFPFLEKQRHPGSITLGNNPLAIVCLDCSETLWAQSAEYDRWGLPVHKRHFNWMARPPPPEDSVEATVARLPSGETQLPRCPPIEPVIGPKPQEAVQVKVLESSVVSKVRGKGKGDSPKLDNSSPITQSSRKTSLTSTTPPTLDMLTGYQSQQPPIVTVAPMSATHTTILNVRKESLTLPPVLIAAHAVPGPPGIYPQPPSAAVYSSAASYGPYVWGSASRETGQRTIEAYPYSSSDAMHTAPSGWPWIAHPSPELVRYPSYVPTRSLGDNVASRSPTHTAVSSPSLQPVMRSQGSPMRYQSTSSVAGATITREKPVNVESRLATEVASGASERSVVSQRNLNEINYPRGKGSPDLNRVGKKSSKLHTVREEGIVNSNKTNTTGQVERSQDSTSSSPVRSARPTFTEKQTLPSAVEATANSTTEQEKVAKREFHLPKKRNWQVFMKESQIGTEDSEKGKKVEEIPHPKKKKTSFSSSQPAEISQIIGVRPVAGPSSKIGESNMSRSTIMEAVPSRSTDSAMDLTLSGGAVATTSKYANQSSSKCSGAKFRIEYLCQSESSIKQDDVDNTKQIEDPSKRSSVIKCAPKIPFASDDVTMQEMKVEIDKAESPKLFVSESESGKKEKMGKISAEKVLISESTKRKEQDSNASGFDYEGRMNTDKSGGDDDDDKEKGNNEREEQASTLNTDDDNVERKNEDLPNIEQLLKETVSELLIREKEQEKVTRDAMDKQKHFLHGLGLVTPDEKTELEIKCVVSRHERKTLPPIQLRADDCKMKSRIDNKLKELLLKVSIEDPTLFQEKPEGDKCEFMAELGMKTAEKADKTKREIKWRVILIERMRRELRDAAARGLKHEWEKSEILKKFADCDLESFFNSLSYAALSTPDAELNQERPVDGNDTEKTKGTRDISISTISGVCINYPKYIPSYVVKSEEGQDVESTKSVAEAVGDNVEASDSGSNLPFVEPILKIPVLASKKGLHSELATTVTPDIDDNELISTTTTVADEKSEMSGVTESSMDKLPLTFSLTCSSSSSYPIRIDNLIQSSSNYWEQMKNNIDEILEALESSTEDISQEDKASDVEKIRMHLNSQLANIKEIEKRLRATSKNISSGSRKRPQKKD